MEYRRVRDEVSQLSLRQLLSESHAWIDAAADDETPEFVALIHADLKQIEREIDRLEQEGLIAKLNRRIRRDRPSPEAIRTRLVGSCTKWRLLNDGRSPEELGKD